MRVIAIDPGVTSGYCYAELKDGQLFYYPFQIVDDVDDLWVRLHGFAPRYVIIENFEFRGRARTGLNLFPMQLIGVARLYEQRPTANCALYLQSAGQGKGYYTDAILKKNGLYKRGFPHAMDASRHLLQWCTFGAGYEHISSKDREFAKIVESNYFQS